jgi:hypothetical protein
MPLFNASFLLLAQEDSLKKANDAIDTIDKLGKAGPITLALVVAIASVIFAVYLLRKIWQLREDHAIELKNRETAAKTDADKRLTEVLSVEKERRETEKQMLREMIERGHEATDALEGNNKAVEAFKLAMDGFVRRLDELDRTLDKRFAELLRAVDQRSQS